MRRGEICHLEAARLEQGRTLISTIEGHAFLVNGVVFGESALTKGLELVVGSVCGDWCYLTLGESRLRARILRDGSCEEPIAHN